MTEKAEIRNQTQRRLFRFKRQPLFTKLKNIIDYSKSSRTCQVIFLICCITEYKDFLNNILEDSD